MKSSDKQPEQNENVNRIHISFVHSTNGLSSQRPMHECNITGMAWRLTDQKYFPEMHS